METEVSPGHSQEPATCPYPKPDQSASRPPISFPWLTSLQVFKFSVWLMAFVTS